MRAIRARSSIKSKPERVFSVLMDFDSYAEWNPWLRDVKGYAKEGAEVVVRPNLITLFGFKLRYRLIKIQAPDLMLWEEVAWFSPLFRTVREYQIYTKAGGGAIYSIGLRFYGPLAPLVSLIYGKSVRKGLSGAADSLKRYCEKKYPLAVADAQDQFAAFNANHSSPNLDVIKL